MAALAIRVLGPVEVCREHSPLALGGRRQRALLASLLAARGREVPLGVLVEHVWGERAPRSAEHAVQVYVSELRSVLGAETIARGQDSGYRIPASAGARDDERFERLLAEGRFAFEAQAATAARDLLKEALALWRGSAYGEVATVEGVAPEAQRLEELRRLAEVTHGAAELALGNHEELVPVLTARAAVDPTDEMVARQLMLALYRSGRQVAALEYARGFRRSLRAELGLEPSRELVDLEAAILRHDGLLHFLEAPPKDLRLPARITSFVGRGGELLDIRALLARDDVRVATLTGSGGVGKTRLAHEVAYASSRDYQEVVVVGLLGVTAADELDTALRSALRTQREPADAIGDRKMLLVLDEFDGCIGAAGTLERLVRAAPRLDVLVTSRKRLELVTEHVYDVPPLRGDESVLLYRQRTGIEAEEADVDALCERLEGVPLAIEHAASIARCHPPRTLLESLGRVLDLPGVQAADPRHRTLRATIEHGLTVVDEQTRATFERVAVHVGGASAEALRSVSDAGDDAVATLVGASLLRPHAGRLTMLEAVRELGLERLEQSGRASSVRRRHADFYAALAEELEDGAYRSFRSTRFVRELERERANLRAAVAWARESDELERLRRLAASLGFFWYLSGSVKEGLRVLDDVTSRLETEDRWAPQLFAAEAELALAAGDVHRGVVACGRAFSAAEEQGVDSALVRALITGALLRDDPELMTDDLERAAAIAADTGLDAQVVACRNNLAYLSLVHGMDAAPHVAQLEHALEGVAEGGVFTVAGTLTLATAALRADAPERAGTYIARALEHALIDDLAPEVVWLLAVAAAQREKSGDLRDAAVLAGASMHFQDEIGLAAPLAPLELALRDEALEAARRTLGAEHVGRAVAAGRRLDRGEAAALARCGLSRT
jgi:predicted ATPase/DNA-binding SARP family transcriptional activator